MVCLALWGTELAGKGLPVMCQKMLCLGKLTGAMYMIGCLLQLVIHVLSGELEYDWTAFLDVRKQ